MFELYFEAELKPAASFNTRRFFPLRWAEFVRRLILSPSGIFPLLLSFVIIMIGHDISFSVLLSGILVGPSEGRREPQRSAVEPRRVLSASSVVKISAARAAREFESGLGSYL